MSSEGAERRTPDSGWNHQVAEVNGLSLHYVREGSGPPLILLHGWPEFWWTWHRTIPALEGSFDVIAPDLRGFGESHPAEAPDGGPADPAVHAADILALADTLGLERFGIVSHDVGAAVAQQVARTHPERLTGLFFFDCPYPGIGRRWVEPERIPEIWYQSFNQKPWAAELVGHDRETCRIYFENMLRHWAYDDSVFDGQIDHWVDNFMKPGNLEGGFAWYAASHEARMALVRDGAPELPKIAVPSAFYWGAHDPILSAEWVDRLGDYFESPDVEIAEGAGHFVQLERPEEANARIAAFFGGR